MKKKHTDVMQSDLNDAQKEGLIWIVGDVMGMDVLEWFSGKHGDFNVKDKLVEWGFTEKSASNRLTRLLK